MKPTPLTDEQINNLPSVTSALWPMGTLSRVERVIREVEEARDAQWQALILADKDAEIAKLREDAERYRWLRDNCVDDVEPENYGVVLNRNLFFIWPSPSWKDGIKQQPVALEAAIDSARSKQ